ncbi:MAG: ABC transporter ATP-binding protein [Bdellovibrionota bacterium]
MSAAQGLEAYLDSEESEAKKIQPHNVRRLAGVIARHPGILVAGVAMILIGTAANLMEPRLYGYAIDEAIVPKNLDLLRTLAIIYLVTIALRVFSTIAQGYLFELLGQRVTQNLRLQLFSHLQRLPVATFDRNPAGRLLTRATNDIASLAEMFSSGIVSMVCNLLMVVGILIWLLVLDLQLGLIVSAVFPFLIVVSVYFSGRLKIAYREARSKLSALNAFLAENLMGMKVVNQFNRQKTQFERFERINQWYADAQFSSVRVFALFQPTITVMAGISISLVIWYGGRQAALGTLKLGVLAAYFTYVLSLFQPVREIADKWNIFLSGMASAERIFSILNWPVELEETALSVPAEPYTDFRGEIVFENLWFAYEAERWVLKDFSLRIPAGSRLGVVGHTGAGKTTLINLLMRFYEPQRGRVLIDGRDIRELDKRRLRATIGIVQQDVFLFSGTLLENVTFWDKRRKLRTAWPELNLDRPIQERGVNLSVGERQVVAYERVLATDPSIWILDEATANMDSSSEAKLQESLEAASRGRTGILIAHRLSTVKNADQIIVIHKGALLESGNHDQLLARDGLYARLYRFQRASEAAARPV